MTNKFLELAANNQLELNALNLILLFVLKATGLLLGFLTIRIGAELISKGAKGEFKFEGNFLGMSTNLASVSPGLLFVLLGVILMGYAIGVNKVIRDDIKIPLGPNLPVNGTNYLSSQRPDYLLPSNVDIPSIFNTNQ